MCHVLIIEDDFLIAADVGEAAIKAGATSVSFASSPAEALASAQKRPPDILLSDGHLIDGTGPVAVEAIRACLGRLVPVIFITGSPEDCGGLSESSILVKPITSRMLADAMESTGIV